MSRLLILVLLLAATAAAQVPAPFSPAVFDSQVFYGDPAAAPHRWARDEVNRSQGTSGWQIWPFGFSLVCPDGKVYGRVDLDLCLVHGEIRIISSSLRDVNFVCPPR